MQVNPPPPIPATTRPRTTISADPAKPQINVPTPKNILLKTRPYRRENMSVSFPDKGWKAALAIKYPEASQGRSVRELKLVEMGDARVATIVESVTHSQCLPHSA
jgi:hypothetical protein